MRNAPAYLREFGFRKFVRECSFRFVESFHERRLNVDTTGMVLLPDVGIDNDEFLMYAPIGYVAIHTALAFVAIPDEEVSFIDFGSGKGRVVIVAATRPYRKVVGVDISKELNDAAMENVVQMRGRRAAVVNIKLSDAALYKLEDDVNVIYIANSFIGKTLETVVENIMHSYERSPRRIFLIYFNNANFEELLQSGGYEAIKCLRKEFFYPHYSFGLYEIGVPVSI